MITSFAYITWNTKLQKINILIIAQEITFQIGNIKDGQLMTWKLVKHTWKISKTLVVLYFSLLPSHKNIDN